jgi:hypothetical protein
MGIGKEAQRGTQEGRYEGEDTSKKDNEDGKGEGLYCNVVGLRKKKEEDFWAKKKVDGQRKWEPEKKHKGEHRKDNTKGRAQAKI